jgi:nucleoside-diphosphate-sugar epimerase
MNIFISGASGFIGSHLKEYICENYVYENYIKIAV